MRAKLLTTDGRYACTVTLPEFATWPEVIIWGVRVFQLQTKGKVGELTEYREVFAVTAVEWHCEDT